MKKTRSAPLLLSTGLASLLSFAAGADIKEMQDLNSLQRLRALEFHNAQHFFLPVFSLVYLQRAHTWMGSQLTQ